MNLLKLRKNFTLSRLSIDMVKLRISIINLLRSRNMKFSEFQVILDVFNNNFLDTALQSLRKSGQIHYSGHKKGWIMGKGKIYTPNRRKKNESEY